jgi:hypothetical protein
MYDVYKLPNVERKEEEYDHRIKLEFDLTEATRDTGAGPGEAVANLTQCNHKWAKLK